MQESHFINEFNKQPFWFFIKNNKRAFFLGTISLLLTNIFDALGPICLKLGIDAIAQEKSLSELEKVIALYFLVSLLLASSRFGWRYFYTLFHSRVGAILEQVLFRHLLYLKLPFLEKEKVGNLITLLTSDIQKFKMALGPALVMFVDGIMMAAMIVPALFYLNANWAPYVLLPLFLLAFVVRYLEAPMEETSLAAQKKLALMTNQIHESITGIRTIKSFVQEENHKAALKKLNKEQAFWEQKKALQKALFNPVFDFCMLLSTFVLLYLAYRDIQNLNSISLGSFAAFQRYILRLEWPAEAIVLYFSDLATAKASQKRLTQTLSLNESEAAYFKNLRGGVTENSPTEKEQLSLLHLKTLMEFSSIKLDQVYYQAPGSAPESFLLKNINFQLTKGEKVALVGPIGCGKSLLAGLLNGCLLATKGRVLLNGADLNQYWLDSIREKIQLLPQEVFLFARSIEENLRFGQKVPLNEDSLNQLLEMAAVKNEVESLPFGIKTELGEKGVNLSGGQKQRIALARTLATQAEVIIFDESFSAVDVATERNINRNLNRQNLASKTFVFITNKPHVLMTMDRIYVMEKGQIVTSGKHEELLKTNLYYQDLIETQLRMAKEQNLFKPTTKEAFKVSSDL